MKKSVIFFFLTIVLSISSSFSLVESDALEETVVNVDQPVNITAEPCAIEGREFILLGEREYEKGACEVSESAFKVVEDSEKQGADGAQRLNVSFIFDGSSTGATQLFAASGDFENRFSPLMMLRRGHSIEEDKKVSADRENCRRRADEDSFPSQVSRGQTVIAPVEGISGTEGPFSTEEAMAIEKQFRDTAAAYPNASRFTVKEGVIIPAISNISSNNNDYENHEIMRLLKNVIAVRYSLSVANSISELTPLAFVSAKNLSAEKIGEILDKIDVNKVDTLPLNQNDLVPRLRGGMPLTMNVGDIVISRIHLLTAINRCNANANAGGSGQIPGLEEAWMNTTSEYTHARNYYNHAYNAAVLAQQHINNNDLVAAEVAEDIANYWIAAAKSTEIMAKTRESIANATQQNQQRIRQLGQNRLEVDRVVARCRLEAAQAAANAKDASAIIWQNAAQAAAQCLRNGKNGTGKMAASRAITVLLRSSIPIPNPW